MVRQWHSCWTRHCLVLSSSFLFLFILQQPNTFTWSVNAVPARRSELNDMSIAQSIQKYRHEENAYSHNYNGLQRREVVRDVIEKSASEEMTNFPPASSWVHNSRVSTLSLKVASTTCISGSTQVLGPALNGSFASNSPDGFYPQGQTCTWTMQTSLNATGSVGTNSTNSTLFIIAVSFPTPIQLVCGMDYLTLYDGADNTAPVLARLCGNVSPPTIYSSGPQLTAVFTSQAQSPGSNGFTAAWASVDTTGFDDFTPRSQHAMAYDPNKDMVYITGGTSLKVPFIWDLLTYTFATNKWNKITLNTRSPDPRYGHYAFVYRSNLYIYGGVSIIGGVADIWMFNGKNWTRQPMSSDNVPVGLVGSASVVVSSNNSTRLYVFGGLTSAGVTSRDLNYYDLSTGIWKKSSYQNSVGLSGASAVYHQATDSIYYFGGLVNQTTRNVITFQYRVTQDQWYALAPRVDPFTATPVLNGNETLDPSSYFNMTGLDADDDSGDNNGGAPITSPQYYPPVIYDPLTTVWTPVGLMGDDSVVMYSGMKPFGLGVDEKDPACISKSFSIYDLSCQKWTSFDTTDLGQAISGRVNHTMVLRPPGAPGGSKTSWTAYIFGGFNGVDHADMLNVTMNIIPTNSSTTNNCRVKASAGAYLVGSASDVPINGTIQDLIQQRPDLASHVLTPATCPAHTILDLANPYTGTMQTGQEMTFKIYIDAHDLDIQFEIRTLPTSALNFKSLNVWEGFMNMYWRADHGLSDGTWNGISEVSSPIPSDVSITSDNVTLGDNPVITTTGVLNTSELMNRWTKYEGLDASPSSSAIQENSSYVYFPASDPRRFSGNYVFSLTNLNPTALSFSVTVTLLDHPTAIEKPSGSSFNMATLGFFTLGFILAIILLIFLARKVRQLIDDRDASHRAAEMQLLEDEEDERNRSNGLNGGMAMVQQDGSTLTRKPMYRIVVGVQDLDKYISAISGNTLRHRIVRTDGSGHNQARNMARSCSESVVPQLTRREEHPMEQIKHSRIRSDIIRDIGSTPRPLSATEEVQCNPEQHTSLSVEDVSAAGLGPILDLHHSVDVRVEPEGSKSRHLTDLPPEMDNGLKEALNNCNENEEPNTQNRGLMRGWSLKGLARATSFKRNQNSGNNYSNSNNAINSEEREALTNLKLLEDDERASQSSGGYCDSVQELIDLNVLSTHTDLHQIRQKQMEKHQRDLEVAGETEPERRRNPIRVQPLSVEPLPFHTGLVPRTSKNLRRYQKHLARQQQQQQQSSESLHDAEPASLNVRATEQGRETTTGRTNSRTNTMRLVSPSRRVSKNRPTTSTSSSQRLQPKLVRATRSQGSLREVHRVASRITTRTNADAALPKGPNLMRAKTIANLEGLTRSELFKNKRREDPESGIEMKQLPSSMSNVDQGTGGLLETPVLSSQNQEKQRADISKRKKIKMRGRQEYEPGPLLAMNYLIVFPGDSESRRVRQQGDFWRLKKATTTTSSSDQTIADGNNEVMTSIDEENDTLYNTDLRLPPMAIGSIFVPDPVRWWAYKAKQVLDQQKLDRQMKRMHLLKEQELKLQPPQPAKMR
ncbi:Multiple epidermal growth factor-like domains protein 8 [Haplosporangium sp. Z 27]|nr:Multiple epidermal growth factor-like domains protein 8 [Haplosporangium sp. Z 27]